MSRKKIVSYMLIFCMLFSAFIPQTAVFAANEKADTENAGIVLDATKYGADPSGAGDNAQAIQAVLAAAKEQEGPVTIRFPKGEYHIYPDRAYERELYVSNTVGANQNYKDKKIGFLLEDMHDVTIDGDGSTFLFHGRMTTFATIDSTNIRFQNYAFDFYVPTVIDITAEKVTGTNQTEIIYYVPECYNYRVIETPGTPISYSVEWSSDNSPYTGRPYWTLSNAGNYCQALDLKTGLTRRADKTPFQDAAIIEDMGNHRIKITYSNDKRSFEGKCFQMRNDLKDHPGMFLWKSKDVAFENIDAHFMHGSGVIGQSSENLTFDRVRFGAPEGSGRTSGSSADYLQMSGCKGKVTVQGCSFANSHDDSINVHGTYNEVVERPADKTKVRVQYKHGETAGFPNFFVGDEVWFVNKNNTCPLESFTAKVVEIDGPDGIGGRHSNNSLTDITLTLDKEIPDDVTVNNYVIENITWTPEVLIEGNTFQETPTRAVLVTTMKKAEIRNNTFDGLGEATIHVENSAANGYESGGVRDLVIEGNTFYRPSASHGAISVCPASANKDTPAHKNITIQNNTFFMQNGSLLNAKGVAGISFTKNKIYRYEPSVSVALEAPQTFLEVGDKTKLTATATGGRQTANLYAFEQCSQIAVSGNTYDGGLNAQATLSNCDAMNVTNDIVSSGSNVQSEIGTIAYESEDPTVLKVSGSGKVTALAEGKARVRAYTVMAGRKFSSDWSDEITVGTLLDQVLTIRNDGDIEFTEEHNKEILYRASVALSDGSPGNIGDITWSVVNASDGSATNAARIVKNSDNTASLTTVSNGAVEVVAQTSDGLQDRKLLVIRDGNVHLNMDNIVNEIPGSWSVVKEGQVSVHGMGNVWNTNVPPKNVFLKQFDGDMTNATAIIKVNAPEKTDDQVGLIFSKNKYNGAVSEMDDYVSVAWKRTGSGGYVCVQRKASGSGANESTQVGNISDFDGNPHIWLKLVKTDTSIKGEYSFDGSTWNDVGTITNYTRLGNAFYIGFYASNHKYTAEGQIGSTTEFTFSEMKTDIGNTGELQPVSVTYMNQSPLAQVSNRYDAAALKLTAEVTNYSDPNGFAAGTHVVKWAEEKEDGSHKLIPGLSGMEITSIPASLAGKRVKAFVIPQNEKGMYGAPVAAAAAVEVGNEVGMEVESMTIASDLPDNGEATQEHGKTITYTATLNPSNANSGIVWEVADAATGGETQAASIMGNGTTATLTTVSNGAVEVIATAANGKEARKLLVINKGDLDYALDGVVNEEKARWRTEEEGKIIVQSKGGIYNGAAQSNHPSNIFLGKFCTEDEKDMSAVIKISSPNGRYWYEDAGLILCEGGNFTKDRVTSINNYIGTLWKKRTGNESWALVSTRGTSGNGTENANDKKTITTGVTEIWLQIKKEGTKVTGFYKLNEVDEWISIAEKENQTNIGDDYCLGFYAGGGNNSEFIFSDFQIDMGNTGSFTPVSLSEINVPPTASNVGVAYKDESAQVTYTFADGNQRHEEGTSIIRYLASDTQEGPFELVEDIYDAENRWVKAVVIPQDTRGLYGTPVVSAAAVQLGSLTPENTPSCESALADGTVTIAGIDFGSFDSATKAYMGNDKAASNVTEAEVLFQAKDEKAKISVLLNGKQVNQEPGAQVEERLALVSGLNVIAASVLAEDGVTKTDYRFTAIREGNTANRLTGIWINGEPLEGFDPDKTEYETIYEAEDPEGQTVKIAGLPDGAEAAVRINKHAYDDFKDPNTGAAIDTKYLVLESGVNDVYIRVRPETKMPEQVYHFRVFVPDVKNADLVSIALGDGVELEERFDKDTMEYTGTATRNTTTLSVTAAEAQAIIAVSLLGQRKEGTGSLELELSELSKLYRGNNAIMIDVTSPDGSVKKQYRLQITGLAEIMDYAYNADKTTNGYPNGSKPNVDQSIDRHPITLLIQNEDGTTSTETFEKGIGGHAPMTLVYDIAGKGFVGFEAYLGVDQEMVGNSNRPSITYEVYLDGEKVEESTSVILRETPAVKLDLDISGKSELKIVVGDDGHNGGDHVSLGDVKFITELEAPPKPIYTISYQTNPSAGGMIEAVIGGMSYPAAATGSGLAEEGSSAKLTAIPANGYQFAGWYNGEEKISDERELDIPEVAGGTAYVARFETLAPNTHTVAYTADPAQGGTITAVSGDVTGANGAIVVKEHASVTLTAVPNAGYQFDGWFNAAGTQVRNQLTYTIFDVDRDRAYVARFSEEGTVNPPGPGEETCTITYAADPAEGGSITAVSGDVTGANGRITVAKDADVTLTAVANAEYNFAGWYDASGEKAGEEAVLTVAKVTADASYTARFESDNPDNPQPSVKYTIRYAADPAEGGTVTAKAGDVTGVNGAIQVEKDGSVTLTAAPNATYEFLGWYDGEDQKVSEQTVLTVSGVKANADYTAKFKKLDTEQPSPTEPSPTEPAPGPGPGGDGNKPGGDTGTNPPAGGGSETNWTVGMIIEEPDKSIYSVVNPDPKNGTVKLVKSPNKKNFTIPSSITKNGTTFQVTAIENNAFKGDKTLKKLTVGANITTIGTGAFFKAKKLKTIIFKGMKAPKIGKKAFKGIAKKVKVYAPKKMKAKELKKLKTALKKSGLKKATYKKK